MSRGETFRLSDRTVALVARTPVDTDDNAEQIAYHLAREVQELRRLRDEVLPELGDCSLCGIPKSTGACLHLINLPADRVGMARAVWEGLVADRLAYRKLVDDLRAEHYKTYKTTSDEVWETNPVCACGRGWPCDIARMIEEAGL